MTGASQPPPGLVPQLYRALFGLSSPASSAAPSLVQARAHVLLRQAARERSAEAFVARRQARSFSSLGAGQQVAVRRKALAGAAPAAGAARRLKSDQRSSTTTTTTVHDDVGRTTYPVDKSGSQPSASTSKAAPASHPGPSEGRAEPTSTIKELMRSPDLYEPDFRPPRLKVVLCHGLYGYGVRGQIHYWANVQDVLAECGVDLLVVEVPSTGSIEERAKILHQTIEKHIPGTEINFLAHSMGGLDCRYLITHIKDKSYTVRSLTCIATPHRGSPFMDWCSATIGLGTPMGQVPKTVIANPTPKLVPAYSLKTPLLALATPPPPPKEGEKTETSFFTTVITNPVQSLSRIRDSLLRTFDSPAYFNLTTDYCNNIFNPSTPDDPAVHYYSIAARAVSINPLHPLWWTKLILDHTAAAGEAEKDGFAGEKYEGSDGMVSVSSAKWGEFLGIVDDCNHWELRARNSFLERLILRFPVVLTSSFSPPAFSSVYHLPASSVGTAFSVGTASSSSQGEHGKGPTPTPFGQSTSELHSPPPTADGWTLPDINKQVSGLIESSKTILPLPDFIDPRPATKPATAKEAAAQATTAKEAADSQKQKAFLESQASAALSVLGRIFPGFGGGQKEQGQPVDKARRVREEGTAEKFDIERFYRAVMLHLYRRGL